MTSLTKSYRFEESNGRENPTVRRMNRACAGGNVCHDSLMAKTWLAVATKKPAGICLPASLHHESVVARWLPALAPHAHGADMAHAIGGHAGIADVAHGDRRRGGVGGAG